MLFPRIFNYLYMQIVRIQCLFSLPPNDRYETVSFRSVYKTRLKKNLLSRVLCTRDYLENEKEKANKRLFLLPRSLIRGATHFLLQTLQEDTFHTFSTAPSFSLAFFELPWDLITQLQETQLFMRLGISSSTPFPPPAHTEGHWAQPKNLCLKSL